MPIAVVQGEPDRFELKTCPEGYVTIKRMTYGEKLTRRKFNSKMEMEMNKGGGAKSTIDMFNERIELFDFANCIVEHNLTDVDGRQLNFKNPEDVKQLAGKIAEEIGTYIDKVNNFEDDDEVKN